MPLRQRTLSLVTASLRFLVTVIGAALVVDLCFVIWPWLGYVTCGWEQSWISCWKQSDFTLFLSEIGFLAMCAIPVLAGSLGNLVWPKAQSSLYWILLAISSGVTITISLAKIFHQFKIDMDRTFCCFSGPISLLMFLFGPYLISSIAYSVFRRK